MTYDNFNTYDYSGGSNPAPVGGFPPAMYYFQAEDFIFSAHEIESKTGLNPESVEDVALNEVGVYKIITSEDPFDKSLFDSSLSYDISGTYAFQVWDATARTLSDAKDSAKQTLKEAAVRSAGTGDGFQAMLLIAAASKLAADRSTEAQTALDALTTTLDALVVDMQSVDAASDVDAIDAIVNPVTDTFAVTVSGGAFYIDGVLQDSLTLSAGSVYRFDQSDATNSGHPLKIYDDANKTTLITNRVTYSGTPGVAGAFTQFIPVESGTYSYQCSVHNAMGGDITVS